MLQFQIQSIGFAVTASRYLANVERRVLRIRSDGFTDVALCMNGIGKDRRPNWHTWGLRHEMRAMECVRFRLQSVRRIRAPDRR